MTRRRSAARFVLAAIVMVVALFTSRLGIAQFDTVPADVQAELLSKLASYDRNFAARAGETAHVLIVVDHDSAKSQLSAAEMKSALGRLDRIGGLPHQEVVVQYEGADALVARCRSGQIAVVYVTPGFDGEIDRLRAAFGGLDVMTVAAVPDYVPRGIVLGFGLESGKPKLLINLDQARLQHVEFPADVLRLMKVYRW